MQGDGEAYIECPDAHDVGSIYGSVVSMTWQDHLLPPLTLPVRDKMSESNEKPTLPSIRALFPGE